MLANFAKVFAIVVAASATVAAEEKRGLFLPYIP